MKNYLWLLIFSGLIFACSTEKNSFKNRAFHRLTGWFNVLFNGEQAMDEKLLELENGHQDEYFGLLRVDPLPPFEYKEYEEAIEEAQPAPKGIGARTTNILNDDEGSGASGFARAEEKARKAIKKHGMLIDGEEKNTLMSRAYLLLGKAQYFRGKSYDALESFQYLLDAFPNSKHELEAKIYMILAYAQSGNSFSAEELIAELKEKQEYKKKEKAFVTKHLAQYYMDQEEIDSAEQYLNWALEYKQPKRTRARMHYILGQILSQKGEQELAAEHFQKVYKLKPGIDMEVKSQLGIALNFDPARNNYQNYIDFLAKTAKKDAYFKKTNEFDYAKAAVAYKAGRQKEVQTYLDKSLETEKSDPFIRGKAYELYGDLKFDNSEYVFAEAYYDSAIAEFPNEKLKKPLEERLGALKDMIEMFYLVEKNDSILQLAALPSEEQKKFFEKYIEKLKEEEAKEAEEAEELATEFQTLTKNSGFKNTFGEEAEKGKFYFYSQNQLNFGKSEFQRIWGNRRLADNWRLSAQSSARSAEERESELLGQAETGNPRRYEVNYYTEQIPTDRDTLDFLKVQRDTTEFKLGLLYFDKFQDAQESLRTLKHLLDTPPKQEELKQKTLYHLYRVSKLSGNNELMAKYENQVLTAYPESIYAEFIKNPVESLSELSSPEAKEFYVETYQKYKEEDYETVLKRVQEARNKFPNDYLMPKFSLLDAYATGKLKGSQAYQKALENIVLAYGDTEESEKAKTLISGLKNYQSKVKLNEKKSEESPKQETKIQRNESQKSKE